MCTAYTGRCLYQLPANIPILPAESQRSCPGGHAFHPKSTAECVATGKAGADANPVAGKTKGIFPISDLGFALRCLRAWIERSNETCPVCRCKEGTHSRAKNFQN